MCNITASTDYVSKFTELCSFLGNASTLNSRFTVPSIYTFISLSDTSHIFIKSSLVLATTFKLY
jgi:hypothetical protein